MSSDRPKDPRSADSPPDLDIGGGAGAEPDRRPPPGVPRWVKVSLLLVGVLALAAAIVLLVGGGHGPGRHGPTSPVAEDAVEIAVTAEALAFEPAEIAVLAGGNLEDHEDLRDFFEDLHG